MHARLRSALPWLAILLLAAGLRLPRVQAALPYLNYVDEGHVLHHAVHLLRTGGWDPEWYTYPSLPIYAVAAAGHLYRPLYRAVHGHSLRRDLSPWPHHYYDVVEPVELIVLGRMVTLAVSLGLVLLIGTMAARLAGGHRAAGLFATLTAAVLPALVIRGGIVTVDVWVALFVLAALELADRARLRAGPSWRAAAAGAAVGLAFAAKYPALLVALGVATALLLARWPWRQRLAALVVAGAAAGAAAAVAMPALILKTTTVVEWMRSQAATYAHHHEGNYWNQILKRAEWDQPLEHPELGIIFVAVAAAGLGLALADRRSRASVLPWVVYGAATVVLFDGYAFRALRNFLPLIALASVLVALLYARLRERAARPRLVDAGAVALLALLFARPNLDYLRWQTTVTDSRVEAIDWLAPRLSPGDRVLVLEELAILPTELARLEARGAEVTVRLWPAARNLLRQRDVRWLVGGEIYRENGKPIGRQARRQVLRTFERRARFGEGGTMPRRFIYRGNCQTVMVMERRTPS